MIIPWEIIAGPCIGSIANTVEEDGVYDFAIGGEVEASQQYFGEFKEHTSWQYRTRIESENTQSSLKFD